MIKTSCSETKFSSGATPFQKDVTRMIREIGIFLLGTQILGFIMGTIGGIIADTDIIGSELDFGTIMIGLLVICLSQAFAEGERMQKEVDGLL